MYEAEVGCGCVWKGSSVPLLLDTIAFSSAPLHSFIQQCVSLVCTFYHIYISRTVYIAWSMWAALSALVMRRAIFHYEANINNCLSRKLFFLKIHSQLLHISNWWLQHPYIINNINIIINVNNKYLYVCKCTLYYIFNYIDNNK